jgi:hypothetical protein
MGKQCVRIWESPNMYLHLIKPHLQLVFRHVQETQGRFIRGALGY